MKSLLRLAAGFVLVAGWPAGVFAQNAGCTAGRFQGLYAGGHAGLTAHDTVWVDRNAWIDNFSTDWALGSVNSRRETAAFGAQGGFNLQRGCTVFGIEVDASKAGIEDTKTFSPSATNNTVLELTDKVTWHGTVRGRVGVVVDDLLIYATGGVALANVRHNWAITDANNPVEQFSSGGKRWALAQGVGVEWAWMPQISVKAEGLYVRFAADKTSGVSTAGNQTVTFDTMDSFWISRIGANFKF